VTFAYIAYRKIVGAGADQAVFGAWALLLTNDRKGSATMKTNKLLMTVILSALVAPVFAQTATPKIDAREVKQQQRIANGVASGQLTAKETQHLEARESKLVADEKVAKADGVVTARERAKLTREENRDSRAIHKAKHNDKTQ
jgi:hypothetical protein